MMAAFAELERDIIHERTMAGLLAARAQGRRGGRQVGVLLPIVGDDRDTCETGHGLMLMCPVGA